MLIFHSYVSLPEGIFTASLAAMLFSPASFTKCVASTRTPLPQSQHMKGFNPPYHNPVLAKILQSSSSLLEFKKGQALLTTWSGGPSCLNSVTPCKTRNQTRIMSWMMLLWQPGTEYLQIRCEKSSLFHENCHNSGARQIPCSDTTNVGKTITNHLFGNGLYHLFMMKLEDGLWHCFTHMTQKPLPMTIYDLHSKISKKLPPIMAKEGCARSRSLIKPGTSENHSWEIQVDMGHGTWLTHKTCRWTILGEISCPVEPQGHLNHPRKPPQKYHSQDSVGSPA